MRLLSFKPVYLIKDIISFNQLLCFSSMLIVVINQGTCGFSFRLGKNLSGPSLDLTTEEQLEHFWYMT